MFFDRIANVKMTHRASDAAEATELGLLVH